MGIGARSGVFDGATPNRVGVAGIGANLGRDGLRGGERAPSAISSATAYSKRIPAMLLASSFTIFESGGRSPMAVGRLAGQQARTRINGRGGTLRPNAGLESVPLMPPPVFLQCRRRFSCETELPDVLWICRMWRSNPSFATLPPPSTPAPTLWIHMPSCLLGDLTAATVM